MKSRTNLIDIACLIGQPLLLNALSIPAMAYIIHTQGPVRYGQWMVGTSLVALTAFLANLGLRTLFVRSLAQNGAHAAEATAEQLGLRTLLAIGAGLISLILCLCLRYPPVILGCVAVNSIGLILMTTASSLADVLQALQRFKAFTAINFVAGIVLTGISVVAIAVGAGPLGLSIAYLSGPVVSLVLLAIIVHRQHFSVRMRWNPQRYGVLLREVRTMGAQQLVGSLQDRIEQLLIPKLVGISDFGYFAAGSMPANRLVVFPDGLATAYYPKIARDCQEDAGNVGKQVTDLFKLSLVVCVPLALLVTFLAPAIAQILFPRHAEICRTIIQITVWSVPLQGISLPLLYALQAGGKHKEAATLSMSAALISLGISLFLVSRYHLQGACWSWVARPFIASLFLLPPFARTFPGVWQRLPLIRTAISAALMGACLWLCTGMHLSTWVEAGAGIGAGLAVYICTLFILGVLRLTQFQELIGRRSGRQ